ncbi:hypothetical protein, partial [Actinoplanes couchii]
TDERSLVGAGGVHGVLTEPGGVAAGGRSHAEYCRAVQVTLADAAAPGTARAGYAADLAEPVPST